jgi:diguanylate cyclase (GGDEF)-like protein/PAS domain S-box-containing protein
MVAWSRDSCPLTSDDLRALTGSLTDALVRRLAQLMVHLFRGLHRAARDEAPPPSLLDHLPGDAVLLIDPEGLIVRLGRNVGPVLGWSDAVPVGTTVFDHLHPDDRAAAADAWVKPGGDRDLRLRTRFAATGGGWRWFEVISRDLQGDPEVGAIVLTLRDVDGEVAAIQEALDTERALLCLVDASNSGVFRFDRRGTVVYANARWEEITGVPAGEVTGEAWRALVHPEDRDRVTRPRPPGSADEPEHTEFRILRPDGSVHWVAGRSTAVRDEDGTIVGRVGTITDITGHVQARRDSQRLADIFDATLDLVGMADRNGRLLYLNAAARRFFGLPPEGPLDHIRVIDRFPHEIGKRITTEILNDIARDGMWSGELALIRHDGMVVPVLAQLLSHADEHGNVEYFSAILHDIRTRKSYESQLEHQATHDPLTGLPNRALLIERLNGALERARRHGTRVAVLFLDLDHFKVINDSLGHDAGDQVLVALAARLRRALRPGDTVARFGGDEFVVLCADLVHPLDAAAVAERMRTVLSGPLPVGDSEIFVGVSAGIALSDGEGADAGALIRDADAAMYRAKQRGRARWEMFDHAMRADAVDRLDTESSLRRAEERGELDLRYQPIVSLATGTVVGVEALLRWEHPERGLLSPAEFIGVAEETGLIVPMGAWVLERACREVARWQRTLPDLDPLRLSVNLSGRQLGQPGLVEVVRDILASTDVAPEQLELEITESVLMDDVETSGETLRALKQLGVKLVVDDFGTGYSSFSYLRRFPVDVLKVDRSFVDGLGEGTDDTAIVTAIVSLAHTLGLQAVAEGVETPEQLAELRRVGCDLAQGYLFSRPGTGDDMATLLATPPTW